MNEKLKDLLDFLEENIDPVHADEVERLHTDTIGYKKIPYLPLSFTCPLEEEYHPLPYADAYDNPEKMLYNELLCSFSSSLNSVRIKDHFPMQIRSNHGVGIIASMFGVNCRIVNDNMPWVDHFDTEEEILNILSRGMPELNRALGAKVLQTHQYYLDILKRYPKCYNAIHVTQPDLQGPFDIAHLLVGPKIFYDVCDNPELIHSLLELVTETYIAFRKLLQPYLTDKAGDNAVYVMGSIYGGKVLIKDDTAAVNLSPEMYNDFSKKYNEKIFKAFGGGSLHHCGQERAWHFSSFDCDSLAGINYGNPELHVLEKTYEYWRRRKVPILWWGCNQEHGFLDEVYRLNIETGISLTTKANTLKEAENILRKHVER